MSQGTAARESRAADSVAQAEMLISELLQEPSPRPDAGGAPSPEAVQRADAVGSVAMLGQRARYRFDTFMARGGSSIFISLSIVFLGCFFAISAARGVLLLTYPDAVLERGDGLLNNCYITFLQMTDPGNMNQDVDSSSLFKGTAVVAGLLGVVMLSTLVAFITTTLDQKISQLKKGHSKVFENDHTLILGWNERVVEILRELILANESEDDPVVVILADQDKEMMDDYLRVHLPDTKNTRIVTRSGSPASLAKLEIASFTHSKSVIVLAGSVGNADGRAADASDAKVIKTVLALVAAGAQDFELQVVVETCRAENRALVEGLAPGGITTIDVDDILAKILVQTSRSVGLSVVYNEILSFDGCEMYFCQDRWGERTFGELVYHFADGIPMGLRHADGSLVINPPAAHPVQPDDSVLILAEDDSTIAFQSEPITQPRDYAGSQKRTQPSTEHNLVIGWTARSETILREYAQYVLRGSTADVMLRQPCEQVVDKVRSLNQELDSMEIRLVEGDPLSHEGLAAIKPDRYDNIVILSQGKIGDDDETTESETIVILLLLRSLLSKRPSDERKPKLVTEVLDSENQPLIARAGVRDIVISNRFISMLLAQISEDPDIKRVYDDLFDEEGSEIYIKPMTLYSDSLPAQVRFADLIQLAQKRGETCLGVKIQSLEDDLDQNFGVLLNPPKEQQFALTAEDSLVVLAEDDS